MSLCRHQAGRPDGRAGGGWRAGPVAPDRPAESAGRRRRPRRYDRLGCGDDRGARLPRSRWTSSYRPRCPATGVVASGTSRLTSPRSSRQGWTSRSWIGDLFYVLRNHGGGVEDVARALRPFVGHASTREALDVLRRDFHEVSGLGPNRVAQFLFGGPDDAIQADVVGFVSDLLRRLQEHSS
jgi:hypothetical protein